VKRVRLTCALLLLLCACAQDQPAPARTNSATASDTSKPAAAPAAAPATQTDSAAIAAGTASTITHPVVIYLEASAAEIEAERTRVPEDDFAVMADDLMFYRSSALEYLQKQKIPFVHLVGRRPLEFRVGGAARKFDFKDVTLLDFIIVYEPDREPRFVAPNEVETVRLTEGV